MYDKPWRLQQLHSDIKCDLFGLIIMLIYF